MKSHRLAMAGIVSSLCMIAVVCTAQTYTTIAGFNAATGLDPSPRSKMIEGSDENFYGATGQGGTAQDGTVFKVTPSGVLTTIYNFCSQTNCSDGKYPSGLVLGTDGNFYGTTGHGGGGVASICSYDGCGTVFKITPTGNLTTIYSFCSDATCSDGASPSASLVQGNNGNFYGITFEGGTPGPACSSVTENPGCGTVFEITPTGVLTKLYSFCSLPNCVDGYQVGTPLMQGSDGNFYGVTTNGGVGTYCSAPNVCGTVFRITPARVLTTLYNFCSKANCADGGQPNAGLIQANDGNFYGTTTGTLFQITPSGILTTLHTFGGSMDGTHPFAPLMQSSSGLFYGTTQSGGSCARYKSGCGTIFEYDPMGTYKTIFGFCSTVKCPEGYTPVTGLVEGSDGRFYGTTSAGGPYHDGTIFAWSTIILPPTFAPDPLGFGSEVLNMTSPVNTLRMTNPNADALSVDTITASASFNVTSNTCGAMLSGGKWCSIGVTFTPMQLGKISGQVSVADSGPNSPQSSPLSGVGVQPVTLTPIATTYPSQTVGTTSPAKNFTLNNNLSTALSITNITFTGNNPSDFAQTNSCSSSVAAKGKCTISVIFTPQATGTRTATLTVHDSGSNSPQTSSLKGTGK